MDNNFELQSQANKVIAMLKEQFSNDRFLLDLHCSQLMEGERNKLLRQQVIKNITRENRPLTRCSLAAVADVLMGHFRQPVLF